MLAFVSRQSARYLDLEREIAALEKEQERWVESNNRLIVDITTKSSAERIDYISRNELGLIQVKPEDILQIRITGGEL
jgi:cell division protein FtsB